MLQVQSVKISELYFEAVEPALEGTLVLFKLSPFYKTRKTVFNLIETCSKFLIEQIDDTLSEIKFDAQSKKVSSTNANIYKAYFDLTHPAFNLISEALQVSKESTEKENIILAWENIFTEEKITKAACNLQTSIKIILETT